MARAAYWHGLRLWEHLQWLTVPLAPAAHTENVGIDRTWGGSVVASPNTRRSVSVRCFIEEMAAGDGLDAEARHNLVLLQMGDALAALAHTKGSLAYVRDTDRKASVTGGPYAGPGSFVVTHSAPGGTWAPTTGRYVLARNPASGEGFVAVIAATGAGPSVTITVPAGYTLTTAWRLLDAAFAWQAVRFVSFDPGEPIRGLGDVLRADALYQFAIESAVQAHVVVARDTT